MRKLFSLFVTLLATTALWAHDFEVDGIYYNDLVGNNVEVTYEGSSPSYYAEYSGEVTIPATVTYNGTTYSVTSIGSYAFEYCSSLTSVTIGNSVTSIGYRAFDYCTSLTSITIPNSVTSIGEDAFQSCDALTSIAIPNSVTSIGEYAFSYCDALTSVTIGNSVTSIGDGVFSGCSSLSSITIPNSVTSIGDGVFSGCSSLSSITIPNSVTSIGDDAFLYCSSLSSITIPNSVTSIGEYAFYNCKKLTSITIPNSVTSIGNYAFSNCSSLYSITCLGTTPPTLGTEVFSDLPAVYIPDNTLSAYQTAWGNEYVFVNNETTLTLHVATPGTLSDLIFDAGMRPVNVAKLTLTGTLNDDDFTCMRETMTSLVDVDLSGITNTSGVNFKNKTNLVRVVLPANLKSIGEYAFYDCSSLSSITIPNSVTSIGNYAFYNCSSLSSITIPNSVTSIGEYAFYNCKKLTSITIPNSVTSIGNYAFSNCSSLTSITIPNSVTSIGNYAFRSCSSLTSVTIGNSVKSIGEGAFHDCSSLTSVTIPNSVTSIGNSAFYRCSSLTSMVVEEGNTDYDSRDNCNAIIETATNTLIAGCQNTIIPNSVTSIGEYAFYDCSSLTSITIPNSVTSIGDEAFRSCSSLTSITIGNSVTSIGDRAFQNCRSLTSITIPNSVTSIGYDAFYDCSSLTSVTIPNSVTSIGYDAFDDCSSLISVVWNAENYADFSNSSYAPFYDIRSQITSFTFGEDVKHIPAYLCYGMSKLKSITIPNSVTSIGESTFSSCSGLRSVVWNAEYYASSYAPFDDLNSQITSFTFGEDVKHIPAYLCCNMYILSSITIPNSVTSIGDYAFYYCFGLTSITIGNSVTSIGNNAFGRCSGLRSVVWNAEYYASSYAPFDDLNSQITSFTFGEDVKHLPAYLCCDMYNLTSITIPNSVTSIGKCAFYGCSGLTSVTIGNSVTSIGDGAFRECSGLTSITIPNNVTSIGDGAFMKCSGLTSITIPNSVTSIGDYAFYDCFGLTSVTIGNSVTSIGYEAFYQCYALTSITIPNSVTSIGYWAFYECSGLTSINVFAEVPPTLGNNAFYNVSTTIPVYVPCGSAYAYQSAEGWNKFTNIQELLVIYSIEVGVNDSIMGTSRVDYNTCSEGAQITATPNCGYHFTQWSDGNTDNPRTLVLTQDTTFTAEFVQPFSGQCGDNLYWAYDEVSKTIAITGSGDMYDYTKDTQPWYLFQYQITEVTTSNTTTSIGKNAFAGCVRLSKVSLGIGMENIAANAFAECNRLYDIYCYASYPPFADESSFANYNVYVYIPCENQRDYILDVVWGKFKFIECIGAESDDTGGDDVTVTPGTNDVTITWPTEDEADTYSIVITKDGEVFCKLTFNKDGQLLNVAFAPSRNGQRHAPAATQATNGFTFTVTGLDQGTDYSYNLVIKDNSGKTLQTYSGEFRTQSTNDRTVTVEYDAAQGQVTGAGTYLVGDTVILTATPNDGYRFVRWSNEVVDNPYTFVITENITLSAEFEKVIATSIEHTHSQSPMTDCQKIIHNGQLIILRDGVEYNAQGQIIKE